MNVWWLFYRIVFVTSLLTVSYLMDYPNANLNQIQWKLNWKSLGWKPCENVLFSLHRPSLQPQFPSPPPVSAHLFSSRSLNSCSMIFLQMLFASLTFARRWYLSDIRFTSRDTSSSLLSRFLRDEVSFNSNSWHQNLFTRFRFLVSMCFNSVAV